MKTLDEIINNENYNHLNGVLVERSRELAEKIREAMRSVELTEIGDYEIRTIKSRSGFSYTSLYITSEIEFWDSTAEYHDLESGETRYFCNDFNCLVIKATGKERLKFLNDAKSLLFEIDKIKNERMKEITNAIEETKDL